MSNNWECPMCRDDYSEDNDRIPVVLPECGHSLCLKCAKEAFKDREALGSAECPVDKKVFQYTGLDCLTRSPELLKLAEEMSIENVKKRAQEEAGFVPIKDPVVPRIVIRHRARLRQPAQVSPVNGVGPIVNGRPQIQPNDPLRGGNQIAPAEMARRRARLDAQMLRRPIAMRNAHPNRNPFVIRPPLPAGPIRAPRAHQPAQVRVVQQIHVHHFNYPAGAPARRGNRSQSC